ncbi:MAG: PAC2 family protein [Planctomycetes bacterium]|nr:PAC2 family protein [Planctomycetota bacterium]
MNLEMFRFTSRPHVERPSLIVGWTKDVGAVSRGVADFLADTPGTSSFGQVRPVSFFPVGGVTVNDDVAEFPQSRLVCNERENIVILRSDEPSSHRYEFLNGVLDLAEEYHGVETLYTVNGIASMIPHTANRRAFLVSNDLALQRELRRVVPAGLAWQGPPNTSIYLLWLAKNRHLPGVGLWVEVPFYLVDSEDFQAIKTGASLLGRILGWPFDLDDLDQRIAEQDETLTQLREQDPEIDTRIRILEQGESLDGNEQRELVEAVQGALKEQSR